MINRNNYEEYFLLLIDKELAPGEEAMVKAFAAQHPDLQEELDILLSCTLDAADIPAFPKEKLFHTTTWDAENPAPVQTQMLLLLDNELPANEKGQLEQQIAASLPLQKEWSTLQQTKLVAEAIAHPDKESLYRNERKVRPLVWMRWAAAAAVLIGFSWALWPVANNTQVDNGTVAANNSSKPTTITSSSTQTVAPNPVKSAAAPVEDATNSNEAGSQDVAIENKIPNSVKDNTTTTPAQEQKDYVSYAANTSQKNSEKNVAAGSNEMATTTLHNIETNLDPVAANDKLVVQTAHLTPTAITLPTNEAAKQPAEVFTGKTAAVMSDDEEEYIRIGGAQIKKQKMRGIFRSVSRSVTRSLSKSKLEPDVYATR